MWQFQGFKTKEDAEKYRKENGGYICWEERTPKRKLLTSKGKDYMLFTSMMYDNYRKDWPYIVAWRI